MVNTRRLRRRLAPLALITVLAAGTVTVGTASAERCQDCEPGGGGGGGGTGGGTGGGGTGGGTGSNVPTRHVKLTGSVAMKDAEGMFNDDKFCSDAFTYELAAPIGQWTVSRRDSFCGGEVRVETYMDVFPATDGTMQAVLRVKLFEGTDYQTRDLDGEGSAILPTLAAGASAATQVSVLSDEAGASDYGSSSVTFTNA
ncbi:hypothetical protein ACWGR4_07735 [Embleya sp. NPDC055664]|uniref:hypothetical protein n=1 Tax=Embleya sp. NPDC059237 TaxID=3346784 RepID=UPI00368B5F3D